MDHPAAPGATIGGRYVLRAAIGHGGMGTVWRANDVLLRRDVAVKEVLLPPGMAASDRQSMYQRTLREARAAAALSHPAVVQVYDVVTEDGRPWIVMELLQARSLSEMIIEDGPLAARAVAKIGLALLGALEVAHAASVLHRDVKPANVLICSDGRCVLTDFGVARMPTDSELTTPGMVLGSPHFISPERAIGAPFGPPSDLFSLGVTLYTAVEGRPPFDKRDPFETMRAVVEEPPAPAVRAGALAGVLYGLLEKDPARRWSVSSARAVLRDLLAGPLASNAPAHVTDPYAVVRPAWGNPQPPPPPKQSTQIGGRAMLAPGETVSSAIRRKQNTRTEVSEGRPPTQRRASELERPETAATAAAPAVPAPGSGGGTATYNSGGGSADSAATTVGRTYRAGRLVSGPAQADEPTADVRPDRSRTSAGPGLDGPVRPSPLALARPVLERGRARFSRLPRWAQVVAVAATVGVLIIGVSLAVSPFGADEPGAGTPQALPSNQVAKPAFEVQEYIDDRGIRLSVPKGWTKQTGGTYVDFIDPTDPARKLRINVEKSGPDPVGFLKVAEANLRKGSTTCLVPYAQVGLRTVELDGKPAGELEYTCGQGDKLRHGLWRAVTVNGKAYHFFLSVPASRFQESKPIYDEMVTSFQLSV